MILPPPPPRVGNAEQTERLLCADIWGDLEKLLGVKFTLDGARLCNKDKTQTHAKQLPQMCSTMRSFLHTDLTSHTVCLNPPFMTRIIQQCLTHFAACKRTDPRHTSLCILLPAWHNAKWLPLTQNMRIIKEYPAGTQLSCLTLASQPCHMQCMLTMTGQKRTQNPSPLLQLGPAQCGYKPRLQEPRVWPFQIARPRTVSFTKALPQNTNWP